MVWFIVIKAGAFLIGVFPESYRVGIRTTMNARHSLETLF
jgi:hypothetical protein